MGRTFSMGEQEEKEVMEWIRGHRLACEIAHADRRESHQTALKFVFTPTTVYDFVEIWCACGAKFSPDPVSY